MGSAETRKHKAIMPSAILATDLCPGVYPRVGDLFPHVLQQQRSASQMGRAAENMKNENMKKGITITCDYRLWFSSDTKHVEARKNDRRRHVDEDGLDVLLEFGSRTRNLY